MVIVRSLIPVGMAARSKKKAHLDRWWNSHGLINPSIHGWNKERKKKKKHMREIRKESRLLAMAYGRGDEIKS